MKNLKKTFKTKFQRGGLGVPIRGNFNFNEKKKSEKIE
tara:strand:- start:88 stop:201 length:114 start_codon:yes stop_codon:yes gene_type:complete